MSLDVSGLSATPDYSSLLSSMSTKKGLLNDNTLTQWSMLRSNGKALKAALRAEERGYLRDSEAPAQKLMSEKYFDPAERSTTISDILTALGIAPAGDADAEAAEAADTEAAADTTAADASTGDTGSTVDVTA